MANDVYKAMGDIFGYESAYVMYSVLSAVPFVGTVFSGLDSYYSMRDYFGNTGLSWSDVQYPVVRIYLLCD